MSGLYRSPVIQPVSEQQIISMSQDLQLDLHPDDISTYCESVNGLLKNYDVMENYVEPSLPVKYPRTPGYRPQPEDNKHNAWYYRSEIRGAPSGLLKGYTVAIKDSIPVAGVPMMCGSRLLEGYVPDYDPTVITRLLDAGATIVGKAVCEDFCFSGMSFQSHPAPVLNPNDTTRTTGGSSSGCAALVKAGECDMAIGGDQGGSIRMPSCWTGIVGLKPTYGLVPYTGIGSMTPAIDHIGPMTKNVTDCATMLQAIAGDDGGLDMRQRNIPRVKDISKYSQMLSDKLDGLKVGILTEGFANCNPDVETMVRDQAMKLATKGATVCEVSVPMHKDGSKILFAICAEGSHYNMVQSQGHSTGPPSAYATSYIDTYFNAQKTRNGDQSETMKMVQLLGKYVNDTNGLRFYGKSQNLFRLLREKYDEALAKCDVLIMPTIPFVAPKLPDANSTKRDRLRIGTDMIYNTAPFNGTGHPAISVPVGTLEGLPVGLMVVGRHLEEQTLLNVALALERISGN